MQQPPSKAAAPSNTGLGSSSSPIALPARPLQSTQQNAGANVPAAMTLAQPLSLQANPASSAALNRPVAGLGPNTAPSTNNPPGTSLSPGPTSAQPRPPMNSVVPMSNQTSPRNMPAPQMRIQPQAPYVPGTSSTQSYSAMSPISELPPFPNPPSQSRSGAFSEASQSPQMQMSSSQPPTNPSMIPTHLQNMPRVAPSSMPQQFSPYQGQHIKTQAPSGPTLYRDRMGVRPPAENEPPLKMLRVDERTDSVRADSMSLVNFQMDEKKVPVDNRDSVPMLQKLQKEPLYINVDLVKQMIEKKVHGAGLIYVKDDVLDMISKMTAFRMRNIMEELVRVSSKRTEKEKEQYSTYITEDVKPYLEQIEKDARELDLKEKETNAIQVKDKAREKELRREQLREKEEEDKFKDTNNTAIAAIEGRLRYKPGAQTDTSKSLNSNSSTSNKSKFSKDGSAVMAGSSVGVAPGSDANTADPAQKLQKWVRPVPIPFNSLDIVFTMGRDPRMRKSALYYRALYKTFA